MSEKGSEQNQVTDLTAILEVARRLGLSYDLDEILDLVIAETLSVLNCERATLFLYDPIHKELYSKIATGTGQIRIPVSSGIAGAAAVSGKTVNIPDAYADPRFNRQIDQQTGFRTRNILSCPLVGYQGQLVGVLQAINKHFDRFSSRDEWLLETLGSQAGVAIQRAHLLREHEEKQRLVHELNLAREIQMGLLPRKQLDIPGYDIAGWNRPADQTGGDCYDFLITDGNEPGILLADASGHGIAPALVVLELRAILHSLFGLSMSLEQIMHRVNNILCQDLPADRFVTAFCGVLSHQRHELHYCSAGQGPLIFIKPDARQVEVLSATTCPFGIIENLPFAPADPIIFDPGDLFILVTDGFFEWADVNREQYGIERLTGLVLDHAHLSASELIEEMRKSVEAFGVSTQQGDDLTAVVIKRDR